MRFVMRMIPEGCRPVDENEIVEVRQVQELEDFGADMLALAADFPSMQNPKKKPG